MGTMRSYLVVIGIRREAWKSLMLGIMWEGIYKNANVVQLCACACEITIKIF